MVVAYTKKAAADWLPSCSAAALSTDCECVWVKNHRTRLYAVYMCGQFLLCFP